MLPLDPAQIKRRFQDALKQQGAGRLDAAERIYLDLLKANPTLAEVHFQLGRIALSRGQAQAALTALDRARELKPGETAIWQLQAEALARLGDAARSKAFLKEAKAARLPSKLLVALQNRLARPKARSRTDLGTARAEDVQRLIRLMKARKLAEAEAAARTLRKAHPEVPVIANILANCLVERNRSAEAAAEFEAAIRLAPDYAEAHTGYGRLLLDRGEIDGALRRLRRAVDLAPDLPTAQASLGLALARAGEGEAALAPLRRAVALEPRMTDAQLALAQHLLDLRQPEAAEAALRAAMKAGQNGAPIHLRLAQALAAQGQSAAAEAEYDRAIAADPKSAVAHSLRGLFRQTLGRFEEAESDFRTAIALDPDNGEHYRTFAASVKFAPGDPLIAEMEARFADESLSDASRMHLAFALARAMEATKAHDRVFPYLATGNALMRKRFPYDIATRRAEVDAVKSAFAGTDFVARTAPGCAPDFAPIFVTGMPRSGTTLVEQIIASHSRVGGAGEVGYFARAVSSRLMQQGGGYRPFDALSDTDLCEIGEGLAERLKALVPGAERVTDKSIQTYMVMGAVKLALPKAHIVLVKRDPRDTLFSIYKNLFAEGTHRYAYDLRDLGLYYRMFEEMVAFWRERLPGGFHEIQYEDLIADPEAESRKLVAACGLDWEEACLSFHETERRVSTLSVFQVRQPIYKSSVAAWERYKDELAPMFQALGDAT